MMKTSSKKSNTHKRGNDPLTKIGKTMCFILRHHAHEYNLLIESSGFVKVEDFLNTPPMKKLKVTQELLLEVVKNDEKGRYEVVDRPPLYIRAVQGHSIKSVKDEDILEPVSNIFEYPVVVHGTYFEAWDKIKLTGLNRMSRNSIHFSIGYKEEDHVISGMRKDCQVYIELNAIQTFYNDIKFYISKNKVVLSPGHEGVIPANYIKKVVDNKGKILHSQKYEIGIKFNFTSFVANSFSLDYSVVELGEGTNLSQCESILKGTINTVELFNSLSCLFIDKEIIKKPFVILIREKQEQDYVNLINTLQNEIRHIAFFSDYLVIKNETVECNELTTENMKRIELDYGSLFKVKIQEEQMREEEIEIEEQQNDISEFRLSKKILNDTNIIKNYLLLFLNFEEEDILTSIDCILIPGKDLTSVKFYQYKLQSIPVKKNLDNFLNGLKIFLTENKVIDKLLLLCVGKDDYEYLSKLMKKNLIKKPKFFQRNVILINSDDFASLESNEYVQAAELFLLQYVLDETTVEKIKIMY